MKMLPKYTKVMTLGNSGTERALMGEVVIQEKIDGCVGVNEDILTADLKYVLARNLKIGDKLLAFTSPLPNKRPGKRSNYYIKGAICDPRIAIATVTNAKIIEKKCYLITTENTDTIVSVDHPFLIRKKSHDGLMHHWKKCKEIKIGDKIVNFPIWEHEKSWVSGYIAGQFDADGCLHGANQKKKEYTRFLSYTQAQGKGLEYIQSELQKRGFKIHKASRQRKPEWSVVDTICVRGGVSEFLRFLGMFRPRRLLNKLGKFIINCSFRPFSDEEVTGIKEIGNQKVMGLSTDTGTYIANGLFSHNSQFRFGVNEDGEFVMGSKGVNWEYGVWDKMFNNGCEYLLSIEETILTNYSPNTYFYCEYLNKPKHNVLKYDRVPKNHLALFDVLENGKWMMSRESLEATAIELEIDVVPELYRGVIEMKRVGAGEKFDRTKGWTGTDFLKRMIHQTMSILGGIPIEGVVIKNYGEWINIGGLVFPVFTKYVRAEYKEQHDKHWKAHSPKASLEDYFKSFNNENRWLKSVQHLEEDGKLTNTVKDIGPLLIAIQQDIKDEETENIKDYLFKHFIKNIGRMAIRDFAEWYKEYLIKKNVEGE